MAWLQDFQKLQGQRTRAGQNYNQNHVFAVLLIFPLFFFSNLYTGFVVQRAPIHLTRGGERRKDSRSRSRGSSSYWCTVGDRTWTVRRVYDINIIVLIIILLLTIIAFFTSACSLAFLSPCSRACYNVTSTAGDVKLFPRKDLNPSPAQNHPQHVREIHGP